MGPRRASVLQALVLLLGGWACDARVGAAASAAAAAAAAAAAVVSDDTGASAAAAGGAATAASRALQEILTEGETVVNGVLRLLTTEGVAACAGACAGAFSSAFGVEPSSVGCLCPSNNTTTGAIRRRSLFVGGDEGEGEEEASRRGLRGLAELDESEPVLFAARVSGGLDGGAEALSLFSESTGAVASAFGIQETEMEISTLTVTPPSSGNATDTLEVITDYFDASDIDIVVAGETVTWAGGARGVALFLALLVLLSGTCCCCVCVALGMLWKTKKSRDGAFTKPAFLTRASSWRLPKVEGNPRRSRPGSNMASPTDSAVGLVMQGPSDDAKPSERGDGGSSSVGGGSGGGGGGAHAGDEAAGGGGAQSRRAPASFAAPVSGGRRAAASFAAPVGGGGGSRIGGDSVERGLLTASPVVDGGESSSAAASPAGGGVGSVMSAMSAVSAANTVAAAAVVGDGNDDQAPSRDVSVEESGGTNPLFKTAGGGAAPAPATPMETPGRSRLSKFLGNATPSRLRRLAGRVGSKSPAPSADSRRSKRSAVSRHSRSGSSGGSRSRSRRSHRRQGSFPGAYSQRNSSELDHQRPPADPVYTFMIKTIAGRGYKFMSTTEIAFCAMRMYSHFRRTEGNYRRLTVMQNAENIAPVYEIICKCDGTSVQNPQGVTRFFSSTKGTDAEQQKSLLACLLALSWDRSSSSCKTLQRSLTPSSPSKVPLPEDTFWDEFKDNTDALSGDDQMVVVARVVLLVAGSANVPTDDASESSAAASASAAAAAPSSTAGGEEGSGGEGVGVEYGDVMQGLSGAHLRDVGISIKEARPGWQEAHVQLVSVLLVIAFLEEGARNSLPGGKRPDPLSSLEWVTLLTPEALDAFLVEKLEARRVLVELDLEPSGLVIKHDDDGEVERVEPAAMTDQKPRDHSKILPKASSSVSSSRKHRRRHSTSESVSSSSSKPSPVVITTVHSRKASRDVRRDAAAASKMARLSPLVRSGGSSVASADSSSQTGGPGSATGTDRSYIRTVAQQKTPSSSLRHRRTPSSAKGKRSSASTPRARGGPLKGSGGGGDGGGDGGFDLPPPLTIDTADFNIRVPAQGSSVRSGLSRVLSSKGSQGSSVVTRVYAPSSVGDRAPSVREASSWATEGLSGRPSPVNSHAAFPSLENESAMSQSSIAASRYVSSPSDALGGQQIRFPSVGAGGNSSSAAGKPPAGAGSNTGGAGRVIARVPGDTDSAAAVSSIARAGKGLSQDLTGLARGSARDVGGEEEEEEEGGRPRLPSAFSETAQSEAAFSEAASRYEAGPSAAVGGGGGNRGSRRGTGVFELVTPTSAAGSRFDASSPGSAMTFASRVGVESPTAAAARAAAASRGSGASRGGGGGGGLGVGGLLTGKSAASSMRSDAESSFFRSGGSQRSLDSRGGRASEASATSSWDEEDLQNLGTRWLADRAYNQQFDESK